MLKDIKKILERTKANRHLKNIRKLYYLRKLYSLGLGNDLKEYQKKNTTDKFTVDMANLWPINEKAQNAGVASGAYFFQDIWAAKKVYEASPARHFDIGSRIDGFIAHLLVFRDVNVIDIRKLDTEIEGLDFIQDDATLLERFEDDSLESVSTLHAAEHFGLGRYGDQVDPFSYIKFAEALKRKLAPKGRLYYSVPCGKERLEFNAHRVFSPYTVLNLFKELKLVEVSGVLDDGKFYKNIDMDMLSTQETLNGCGFFEFTK
jgi:SAM-dependent methyltransferase